MTAAYPPSHMTAALSMTGRSSTESLLGIDLGTSSVKVVMTDIRGGVLSQAAAEYTVTSPRPGWAEADPADWLSATVSAVGAALAAAAPSVPHAVGLSGQMHGLVPTDAAGQALRPAMLWSDARAIAQLSAYRDLPDWLSTRLANPLSPGMAGPMLAWLAENETQTYRRTRWALTTQGLAARAADRAVRV